MTDPQLSPRTLRLRKVAATAVVTIPAAYVRALEWQGLDYVTVSLQGTRETGQTIVISDPQGA